jgi:pilus assembly protein Flp/PilA
MAWLSQFDREEEGQGLVEYALIIVLVSIVSIAALTLLGTQVAAVFTTITAAL